MRSAWNIIHKPYAIHKVFMMFVQIIIMWDYLKSFNFSICIPYCYDLLQFLPVLGSPSEVVTAWDDEKSDYVFSSNTCNGVCGHNTQVKWAKNENIAFKFKDLLILVIGASNRYGFFYKLRAFFLTLAYVAFQIYLSKRIYLIVVVLNQGRFQHLCLIKGFLVWNI